MTVLYFDKNACYDKVKRLHKLLYTKCVILKSEFKACIGPRSNVYLLLSTVQNYFATINAFIA